MRHRAADSHRDAGGGTADALERQHYLDREQVFDLLRPPFVGLPRPVDDRRNDGHASHGRSRGRVHHRPLIRLRANSAAATWTVREVTAGAPPHKPGAKRAREAARHCYQIGVRRARKDTFTPQWA